MTPVATQPRPSVSSESADDHRAKFLSDDLTGGVGADTLTARAAGMLPAQLLQPGEIIILLLKPSPWFILLAPLRTLIGILILACLLSLLIDRVDLGISHQNLILATMVVMILRVFWQFLEWLSRVYVLTDRRVITVAGVIRVLVFESPLDRVQHTYTHFSLRERLFGLGTICIATAGTAVNETWWQMLSQPLDVHRKIVQTLQRYRR
ncbi:MAG: hypothetical protein Kow00105_03700 [Phycisphaeraceae bacterium]